VKREGAIAEFHTGDVNGDIERAGMCGLIKNDGTAGSPKKTAPNRNTPQVIGLEFRMSVIGIDGVCDRRARGEAGKNQESAKGGIIHAFKFRERAKEILTA